MTKMMLCVLLFQLLCSSCSHPSMLCPLPFAFDCFATSTHAFDGHGHCHWTKNWAVKAIRLCMAPFFTPLPIKTLISPKSPSHYSLHLPLCLLFPPIDSSSLFTTSSSESTPFPPSSTAATFPAYSPIPDSK